MSVLYIERRKKAMLGLGKIIIINYEIYDESDASQQKR